MQPMNRSKERSQMNKITLGGVELDDSLGTVRQVTDVFWFGITLDENQAGNCLDMFQPYMSSASNCRSRRQFHADDPLAIMSVDTPFYLLNIMRARATGSR
jgi:hypothetical protein